MTDHYAGDGGTLTFPLGETMQLESWQVTVERGMPPSWTGTLTINEGIDFIVQIGDMPMAVLTNQGKPRLEGSIDLKQVFTGLPGLRTQSRFEGIGYPKIH